MLLPPKEKHKFGEMESWTFIDSLNEGVGGIHMPLTALRDSIHQTGSSFPQSFTVRVSRLTSTCPGHEAFESNSQARFLMLL